MNATQRDLNMQRWNVVQHELIPELRHDVGSLTPRLERVIHTLEWMRIEEFATSTWCGIGRPPKERARCVSMKKPGFAGFLFLGAGLSSVPVVARCVPVVRPGGRFSRSVPPMFPRYAPYRGRMLLNAISIRPRRAVCSSSLRSMRSCVL